MTTSALTTSALTTSALTGELRRTQATLADPLSPMPTPGDGAFTQVIAVEEVCPAGAEYAPPALSGLALFWTRQGRAQLRVGAETWTHQPGALALAASGCLLRERIALEEPWHVCYLLISGPWAETMSDWLRRQEAGARLWTAVSPGARQVVEELLELALGQEAGWTWRFLGRSAELWGILFSDAAVSPVGTLPLRLARLLDGAPAERLTVAQMAARLDLTPRQLLYQFRKAAGEPLAQWIRKRRIGQAQRLLCQGHSVTQAAEQLGYANPYHFSRAFKAVTGVAPSVLRRSALPGWRHAAE